MRREAVRSRRRSVVGLLIVAVLLAGCGDDAGSDEADGATTTTIASTTTSPTTDPEAAERQAVTDALEAADDAFLAAAAPPVPNPDLPALIETHTGPMLEQRQEVVLGLRGNGWAIRLPEDSRLRLEVQSVEFDSDDVAILDVCAVDDGERFVVETGEVIAEGLFTVQSTDAMQRVDGVWKLAERREENRWEGEAGCAVD
jgi:hypothetical protein